MALFSNRRLIAQASLLALCLSGSTGSVWSQANEVVAQQDMLNLANALDFCTFDTTYYVALENLNDVSSANTVIPYDSIQDQGGVYTITPQNGAFFPQRRNLATAFNAWGGPYVSFQQGRTQTAATPYDLGSPLDPWGEPYYLFNPLGLIRGDEGIITLELYGDQFDRYTIVSLGPDGEKSGDDLFRQFGPATLDGTRLTSLKGTGVTLTSGAQIVPPTYDVAAGTTLTLRGVNFGAPSENKHVVFGTTVLDEVTTWTSREIMVHVPETLAATDQFAIQIGSATTNSISATITGSHTAVGNWRDY